jgi:hypothetical protein
MTIGTFLIMALGFAGGLFAAIILTMHSLDEFRAERDQWRRDAIRLQKQLDGKK